MRWGTEENGNREGREGRGSEKAAGAQLSGDTGKALSSILSTAKKISK